MARKIRRRTAVVRPPVTVLECGEPRGIDPVPSRPRVEAEAPRRLAVAPRLRIDPRAVPAEELVGAERARLDRGQELGPRVAGRGALRLVDPADHQVPDALLELPHVPGPGVIRA